MKLPGTLKRLKEQVEEIGYQLCGELKFDSDGNVISIPLRPAPPTPATADRPNAAKGPRRSPMELFSGAPQ